MDDLNALIRRAAGHVSTDELAVAERRLAENREPTRPDPDLTRLSPDEARRLWAAGRRERGLPAVTPDAALDAYLREALSARRSGRPMSDTLEAREADE